MKRRTISMHSKIVGYLLTGILITGCVTAKETQYQNSEYMEVLNSSDVNQNKNPINAEEMKKLKQVDTKQIQNTKANNYALYFSSEGECNKMYYIHNKSTTDSLTIQILKRTIDSRDTLTYVLIPKQHIKLGCNINSKGKNVSYQVIQ